MTPDDETYCCQHDELLKDCIGRHRAMTDMEAKAREKWDKALDYAVESIWNGGSRERIREILMQVRTEAHREGMKNPDKETRIRIYAVGRGDWLEYKQQLINRGMEEAAEVVDEESAHYWRECPNCGDARWGYLHCLHDGAQSKCANCGERLPTMDGDCRCEFVVVVDRATAAIREKIKESE